MNKNKVTPTAQISAAFPLNPPPSIDSGL